MLEIIKTRKNRKRKSEIIKAIECKNMAHKGPAARYKRKTFTMILPSQIMIFDN